MRSKALFSLFLAAALYPSRSGWAVIGPRHPGVVKNVPVEAISQRVLALPPGWTFQFAISASSPGVMPILEIFSYPDGSLIGATTSGQPILVAGGSALASRLVTAVVRGEAGSAAGTVNVSSSATRPSPARTVAFPVLVTQVAPAASHVAVPLGLRAGAHVMTVEQRDGPADTVLIVTCEGQGVKLDDDNGVGAMSWMHLNEPCEDCAVVVARRNAPLQHSHPIKTAIPPSGNVTLIWDDEIHEQDSDRDGLSDDLEELILTNKFVRDSDADGIQDDFEVIGRDHFELQGRPPRAVGSLTSLLTFPTYGAEPNQPDIFVENHWISPCNPALPGCVVGTGDGQTNQAQIQEMEADRIASVYGPAGFSVHIDNGITRPDNSTVSGNWRGAGILLPFGIKPDSFCEGRSRQRTGYFHHVITNLTNFGNANRRQPCLQAGLSAQLIAHELGHLLGLGHGGSRGDENCKPHYQSIMNYLYDDFLPTFSSGRLGVLNGTSLDEAVGLNTLDPQVLDLIERVRGVRRTDGAIDWNLDGDFATAGTRVRGPVNYGGGTDCDRETSARRENSKFFRTRRPILVDDGGRPRVWSVVPLRFGSALGTAVGDLSGCAGPVRDANQACARWRSPQAFLPPGLRAPTLAFSPAIAGNILVYIDTSSRLSFIDLSTVPPIFRGQLGGPAVDGDPIAIEWNGFVRVYAPSSGVLRRWSFDLSSRLWTTEGVEVRRDDGFSVLTIAGIGLARGFQSDAVGERLYAAIKSALPIAGQPPGPAQLVRIELAAMEETVTEVVMSGRTIRFSAERWRTLPVATPLLGGNPAADKNRVSLAYEPFDMSNPADGRFFLTAGVDYSGKDKDPADPILTVTQGNRLPVTGGPQARPFRWVTPSLFFSPFAGVLKGLYLLRVGGQLRAVADNDGSVNFFPNADAILDLEQSDHDDVDRIRRNMPCAASARCP